MEYVLETAALTKRYRGQTALSGLDMHVPKGAIYGFVGRNGAGKSTLIRLICGLQEPTSGSYSLYGTSSSDPRIGRAGGGWARSWKNRRSISICRRRKICVYSPGCSDCRPSVGSASCCGSSGSAERDEKRRGIFCSACVSGSALPWRSRETRTCSYSTSRQTGSTYRGSSKCVS